MTREPLFFDRISGTKTTRCPRHVVSIVCEIVPTDYNKRSAVASMRTRLHHWAICDSRFTEAGHWIRQEYEGKTAADQWKLLYHLLHGRRSAWIVTPSVSEWLASAEGYAELTAGRLWIPGTTLPDIEDRYCKGNSKSQRPGYIVLNGPTEIFVGRYLKTEVHAVSASNYGVKDWQSLIHTYGTVNEGDPVDCSGGRRFQGQSPLVARCQAKWFCGMVSQWRDNDCGIFAETAAKLSYNYYRRKHATKAVVKHQQTDAHRLERSALFGGRAEIYSHRPLKGSFHQIDLRSMYPSILATQLAPVAFCDYGGQVSQAYLRDASKTAVVAASVRIRSEIASYPYRLTLGEQLKSVYTERGSKVQRDPGTTRTMFPVGDYCTSLCGPELAMALDRSEVAEVYEHAIYRTSAEFQPMMRECIAKRVSAESKGRRDESQFWKLIANSFAGRWAQRTGGWVTDNRLCAVEAWSEWVEPHPDTGVPVKCRSVGFVPQYYQAYSDKPKGCPIIFAWLTACGRVRLWELLQKAGQGEVIQADTDGLWVTDSGLASLSERSEWWGDGPGQLRVTGRANSLHFLSPRHHTIDGKVTMSGFADGFKVLSDGRVADYARRSLYPADSADGPTCTIIDERISDVSGIADNHRHRHADGTTIPWRIVAGSDKLHADDQNVLPSTLFSVD